MGVLLLLCRTVMEMSEIYIKKFNVAQAHRLTNHPELDAGAPAWSPDGNWIAFVSKRTGESHIYKIDINGENLQRLTNQGGSSTIAQPGLQMGNQLLSNLLGMMATVSL